MGDFIISDAEIGIMFAVAFCFMAIISWLLYRRAIRDGKRHAEEALRRAEAGISQQELVPEGETSRCQGLRDWIPFRRSIHGRENTSGYEMQTGHKNSTVGNRG